MPRFEYDAIDVAGERITGAMEARSAEAVFERLQALGHLAIDAREISGAAVARGRRWLRWPRALSGEITLFTRELSMMLAAGHQLDHALEVLAEGAGTPEMAALIGGIDEEVRGGQSLSAALEPHADRFSKMYVNMVRAGEASGTVNVILERIAEYREASERLRSTVINALYYPAILITASLASVLLLLTFVVPQFEQVFAEAGASLPLPTRIVVGTGKFLRDYGPILALLAVLGVIIMRRVLKTEGPRRRWDALKLRLPIVGNLVIAAAVVRICRTLGTLLENGVDLPMALSLTRDVVTNRIIADDIDRLILAVREGRGMAEALADAHAMPNLAVRLLRVGDETGNLASTTGHIASFYEQRLSGQVKRLLTLMEPALIVFIGVVVGGIVFSIFLAVISINELIG